MIIYDINFTFVIADGIQSSVTVEEGERATLECPGFVPDPDNPAERYAVFNWYKARKFDIDGSNKVAVYDKGHNLGRITGGLEGRASINRTTGALKIHETSVIDDHYYTCDFRDTAKGTISSETKLAVALSGKLYSQG